MKIYEIRKILKKKKIKNVERSVFFLNTHL